MKKLLDLFCGAGGAGMGYHQAGFDVVGVDIHPQSNYPFTFIQGDALEYLKLHGNEFDFIHASPPCQRFSQMGQWNRDKNVHPDFIDPVRETLINIGLPYVIENVPKSPLVNPIILCGSMFNLGVIRHRLFECFFDIKVKKQCNHIGEFYTVLTKSCRPSGDMFAKSSVANGRIAMQIDWMTQKEMGESIPPRLYKVYRGVVACKFRCRSCFVTLLDLLGASSESEAIENLLAERAAMVAWKADIDTLRIVNRRLIVVVEMSRRACLLLDGTMFLDKKVVDLVGKILDQCKILEKYIEFSRSLK